MGTSRRDFMKVFGVGLASLLVTHCSPYGPGVTCYTPLPVSYPTATMLPGARGRLHLCWLRFGEYAQATREAANKGQTEVPLGRELFGAHREALDELVASGELSTSVADLIHEAYGAALDHVYRSNSLITCYEPAVVDYRPSSAGVLIQQSDVLNQLSSQAAIDPETLARARSALEHDLAFFATNDQEIQALYDRLSQGFREGQSIPSFDAVPFEITPDVQAAALYLVNLLSENR